MSMGSLLVSLPILVLVWELYTPTLLIFKVANWAWAGGEGGLFSFLFFWGYFMKQGRNFIKEKEKHISSWSPSPPTPRKRGDQADTLIFRGDKLPPLQSFVLGHTLRTHTETGPLSLFIVQISSLCFLLPEEVKSLTHHPQK